jgi:beta-ribofuranosylaminobenzene 5'-phosphate synthase
MAFFSPQHASIDMPHRVIVSTGARLHFGLLSHAAQSPRQFGGVGLMVNQPGFRLEVEAGWGTARGDSYSGPEVWEDRVLEVVRRCRDLSPGAPESCLWTLTHSILPHVGLGSGTQLALAVARAHATLQGESECSATDLARRAGRGLRSALGIHGFQQGGLLVEVGKRTTEEISPAASRVAWPEDWQLLLVRPTNMTGLSGAAEIQAFSKLPPMAKALSARLCQIILLELLPAVIEHDFETCGESLFQFGRLVGEYFAPVQGGTYSTPQIRSLVRYLRDQGVQGVGQTSWGPTAFVLCPNADVAGKLVADLQGKEWGDCEILVTTARNSGASVESIQ